MLYSLKDCRTGNDAIYKTTVDITEENGILTFKFVAEHSAYYCPYTNYNDIHAEGDACEVLIGTDPARRTYYEIELSPKNDLMLCKMTCDGDDENGDPILGHDFVRAEDCFVEHSVTLTENGYTAEMRFPKEKVRTGEGEMYFNVHRLETDGGEMDKHLFALSPTMRPKFHTPSYFVWLKDYVR